MNPERSCPPLTRRQRQLVDFLSDYVERRGLSPTLEEMAQHFGVNKVTIFGHIAELERKGVIERSAPGVSRGLRLLGEAAQPVPRSRVPIRVLGSIAAGAPIEAVEDPEVFELDDLVPPGAEVYVLRVRGDSMIEDAICDGDLVLVEHRRTAKNGDTVVAVLPAGFQHGRDEEWARTQPARVLRSSTQGLGEAESEPGALVTLKRYYRESSGVRLQPANGAIAPVFVPNRCGEVEIRGVVIGVVRMLR